MTTIRMIIIGFMLTALTALAYGEQGMEYTITENGVTKTVVVTGKDIKLYDEAARIYQNRKRQSKYTSVSKQRTLEREYRACVGQAALWNASDPAGKVKARIRCKNRYNRALENSSGNTRVSFWAILKEVKKKHGYN